MRKLPYRKQSEGIPDYSGRFLGLTSLAMFVFLGGGCGSRTPEKADGLGPRSLTLTSLTPNRGETTGGTRITIRGGSFTADSTVLFGNIAALDVDVVNNQIITAVAPPQPAGVVNITVVANGNSGGSLNGFTYFDPPTLRIDSITPNSGLIDGGTRVTIEGVAFDPSAGVLFDGQVGTDLIVYNDKLLSVLTPPHPAGAADVMIITMGYEFTASGGYSYVEPAPPQIRIDEITPDHGPTEGGTIVTIQGQDFSEDAAVLFGENAAQEVNFFNRGLISAISPPHPRGRVEITVMAGGVSATLPDAFEFQAPTLAIESITPNRGFVTGGTSVTIRGDAFTENTAVLFGPFAATQVNYFNPRLVTALVPAVLEPRIVDVTVMTEEGSVTLSNGYEYLEVPVPTPSITSLSPVFGSIEGGTEVTIRGENFAPDTAVLFAGRAATSATVVNGQLIVAVTPPGDAPGLVDVTLLYDDEELIAADAFNYVLPGTDDGTDTDRDGLTDFVETSGWEIWVDYFGLGLGLDTFGNVTRLTVTSDPGRADGDGDGLSDLDEYLNRSNPGSPDSDGDGLIDSEEVNRWYTSPVAVDSDGDSRGPNHNLAPAAVLFDGYELFDPVDLFRPLNSPNRIVRAKATSPTLDDTDGDTRTDFEEIDTPARTPILADLPQLIIEPAGEVDVRLNIEYAESRGETEEYGLTLSESSTKTQSHQVSTNVGFSYQQAVTAGIEGGISLDVLKATGTSTVSYGFSVEMGYSFTQESSTTSGRESSQIQGKSFESSESFSTGSMRAAVALENTGNIAYRLTNLSLLATMPNKQRTPGGLILGDSFVPIGTLLPAIGEITLAPGEKSPPIEFAATDLNGDAVKEFLAFGNTLGLSGLSMDFETADGLNFDFVQEVTRAQTALVIIDFGDGEIRRFHVATNVNRNPDASFAGITMRNFLEGVLELPRGDAVNGYTVASLVSGESNLDLHSLFGRRFRSSNGGHDLWLVRGSNEERHTVANFEDIVLLAGDEIYLTYMRDTDNDGAPDVLEFALGTDEDPIRPEDADGDGLTDLEEIVGWVVFDGPNPEGRTPYRASSNPAVADYDDDGLRDLQEFQARSDPNSPDTDGDGLVDGRDPFPTRQARLICVNESATGNPQPCEGYTPECCWEQPYPTLTAALELHAAGAATPNNAADDVAEIWVAQGTYRPSEQGANSWETPVRSTSFTLANNLGIYGGFTGPRPRIDRPGTEPGETKRGQRNADPAANGTVLSGDLLENDLGAIDLVTGDTRLDNSQRVVFAPASTNESAVLDGFMVTGGFALDCLADRANKTGRDCGTGGDVICGTGVFDFTTDDGDGQAIPTGCLEPRNDKYFRWRAHRTGTIRFEPVTTSDISANNTILSIYIVAPGETVNGAFCDDLNSRLATCVCDADPETSNPFCSNTTTLSVQNIGETEVLIRVGNRAGCGCGGRGQFRIRYDDESPADRLSTGGGLLLEGGSATIRNTLFLGNASRGIGGGARINGGNATFENCIFAENVAYNGAGVGAVRPNRVHFSGCSFEQNEAPNVPNGGNGGGLGIFEGPDFNSVTIENCAFVGNQAYLRGAGLFADSNSDYFFVNVEGSRFVSNRISAPGDCGGGAPDVRQGTGGGIFARSQMSITNTVLWDNWACNQGGGIYVRRPVSITNCTIAANRGNGSRGAGVSSFSTGASVNIENSLIWNNDFGPPPATTDPELDAPPIAENLQVTVEDGGLATVRNSAINSLNRFRGNGNIGQDPEFVSLPVGNLQLKPTSPCVDRGNDFVDILPFVPGIQLLPGFDLAGLLRITDGNGDGIEAVDMGAFEVPAQ